MAKIMWIGGSHRRHLYYVNTISQLFEISGGIMEVREEMIPKPPDGLGDIDLRNFLLHFARRSYMEKQYFGKQPLPRFPLLRVNKDNLNSQESVDFVKSINPDLVVIFGCGMIREPLFAALPEDKINLHLGLSPRYRGAATLFWPFYFLEPQYAGTTFHYIVDEPDAGDIVHQTVPELNRYDTLHDVGCKAVVQSTQDAIRLLELYGTWKTHKQRSTGKNFLASDFIPEHLRMIYTVYDDDIVKRVFDGELPSKTPKLFRQFT